MVVRASVSILMTVGSCCDGYVWYVVERMVVTGYSQNSLNPYLSVDSQGYGLEGVREKNKRSRKLTEISRKSYFLH